MTAIQPLKYKVLRVFAIPGSSNGLLQREDASQITTLEEFIENEIEMQREMFRMMNCDPNLSEATLTALITTLETAKPHLKLPKAAEESHSE